MDWSLPNWLIDKYYETVGAIGSDGQYEKGLFQEF